jgi:TolB protein
MNVDGNHTRRLTEAAESDYPGAWSPDGTRIAFSSNRLGSYDVWVMNVDGSGQHP